MPRVAAIDCGTNSLRLLILDRGPDGQLVEVLRRTEIVRLGQGVDASGAFADEALERTFAVLDDYAAVLVDAGIRADRTRMVATSAARDVSNLETFLTGVRERVGVVPEVIAGDREAQLSYVGALSSPAVRAAIPAGTVLVVDIGGGSTELVLGDAAGVGNAAGVGDGGGATVQAAVSLPMGSVRLTERFLPSSPPAATELAAAAAYVDSLLDGCGLELGRVASTVGVAGTVVTLAWLSGAAPADPRRLPGCSIPRADLDTVLARLRSLAAAEIRTIPGMHPGRADVITAGALIATRIAHRVPTNGLVVSISDILDGVALELLDDLAAADRSPDPFA